MANLALPHTGPADGHTQADSHTQADGRPHAGGQTAKRRRTATRRRRATRRRTDGHTQADGRPHAGAGPPSIRPRRTSSSRIRNSSSSFWSFPSWTSCFSRASSISICLICKTKMGEVVAATRGQLSGFPGAAGGPRGPRPAWAPSPAPSVQPGLCVRPRGPGESYPLANCARECLHVHRSLPRARECVWVSI